MLEHPALEIARRVRAGDLSAVDVVETALAELARVNERVNAITVIDEGRARRHARALHARARAGEPLGPLAGVPVVVKELQHVAGLATTLGSKALAPHKVATRDAPIVARLRAAGCVVVGKTNTSELGYKPLTDSPLHGVTLHPRDRRRSPGGSSGGSAALVAAGAVPLATGSDGGGSLRIPAAACGCWTFRPSPGAVPSDPDELWPGISTDGVLARDAEDLLVATRHLIAARDAPPHAPQRRLGWVPDLGYGRADRRVEAAVVATLDTLATAGWDVIELEPPLAKDPLRTWLAITSRMNLTRAGHVLGTNAERLLDPGLAAQLRRARDATDDAIRAAEEERAEVGLRLTRALRDFDALVTPTIASTAPTVDGLAEVDGAHVRDWVRFTYPANLAGLPACSLPAVHEVDGWPVGVQLVGRPSGDAALLDVLTLVAHDLGLGFADTAR